MKMARYITTELAVVVASTAMPAMASETGAGVYPLGIEGFTAGALPPTGVYALAYLDRYHASGFTDGAGHVGLIPDFRLNADVAVARMVVVTDKKILGADYAFHVVVPMATLKVDIAGISGTKTGLVDPVINPFILGWHFKNGMHISTGIDIGIPIGTYDRRSPANFSAHYWNFEPIIAFAYYGASGFTLDAKLMYDFSLRNRRAQINSFNPTGADYRSGQNFHMDYAVGWTIRKKFEIGAAGYFYRQITGDKVSNALAQTTIDDMDGFRGEVVAIGPSAQIITHKFRVIGTYIREVSTRYRPKGDKIWVKFIVPLGR